MSERDRAVRRTQLRWGWPRSGWPRWERPRWLRLGRLPRAARVVVIVGVAGLLIAGIPFAWTRTAAGGHLYDEANAPGAGVALVLGGEVAPGGTRPMPFLKGRLDTAAMLIKDGRAKVLLVTGDAHGGSGNETGVMTEYLTHDGAVDPGRIVTDPNGLDTYDSCLRAKEVYGVARALIVTQPYHLARAVALCRHVGIDADGVGARCDGCMSLNLAKNALRDYFACSKAAWETMRDRRPAVESPPSRAVAEALAGV